MEFQTAKPNARMPRNEKLSLDHYLSVIATHKQLHLTVNLLNQIIDMHGFKKIHKTAKKVLIDAVNSMELMDPSRSTLNEENVSSCAHMTLEEVIKDLADLKWQECCVTSIQTLNSVNYDLVVHNTDAEAESSKPKLKQKTRSRKRRKFLTLGAAGDDSADTATATATAAAAHGCGYFGGSNLITETERMRITDFNDDDFGATGGDCSEYSSTFLPIEPY
ncbi:uncharacterized protein LOC114303614 [Camellia sinensis]|uniref:uncharacterized protein LOC114303614 n=1 Tax=Camellia sinensis TaxID=4442 RepID=UPI001036A072|nr:uncharacterized protein LOC114303614 [Camellia sinensis]